MFPYIQFRSLSFVPEMAKISFPVGWLCSALEKEWDIWGEIRGELLLCIKAASIDGLNSLWRFLGSIQLEEHNRTWYSIQKLHPCIATSLLREHLWRGGEKQCWWGKTCGLLEESGECCSTYTVGGKGWSPFNVRADADFNAMILLSKYICHFSLLMSVEAMLPKL